MLNIKEVFHSVSLKRKTYFDNLLAETELNLMEIEILLFLTQYPENNTFTEIIKSKDYAKSYVSKAITHLVELGYIEKQSTPTNKKLYRLFLLENSEEIIRKYDECVEQFQRCAFANISEEDLAVFEKVIHKMEQNLTEN